MDTIRNYVDVMFKDLPKTKEVITMKLNILDHMEDKYNEMINEGKSENEAVGAVISQFGNIDELKEELGIHAKSNAPTQAMEEVPFASEDEVLKFIKFKFHFSLMIAIGVALCICSVIPPTFDRLHDIGTMFMFFMIACAVAIFIIAGIKNSDFAQFEKQPFQISNLLKEKVEAEYQQFKPKYGIAIAIGVALCILAPMIYMIVEHNILSFALSMFSDKASMNLVDGFSTAAMFLTVAIGVFLLIVNGIRKSTYSIVLQNEKIREERRKEEEENNLYGIIMPLAAILYLILGFCFGWWHPGWLIFPIAALFVQVCQLVFKGRT